MYDKHPGDPFAQLTGVVWWNWRVVLLWAGDTFGLVATRVAWDAAWGFELVGESEGWAV
jgi:hypothetical protein